MTYLIALVHVPALYASHSNDIKYALLASAHIPHAFVHRVEP
jgi:hypothetical protein